jgi:hypothetical protein
MRADTSLLGLLGLAPTVWGAMQYLVWVVRLLRPAGMLWQENFEGLTT